MANTLGIRVVTVPCPYNVGRKERGENFRQGERGINGEPLGEVHTQEAPKTMFCFPDGDLGKPFRVYSLEPLPECFV